MINVASASNWKELKYLDYWLEIKTKTKTEKRKKII